MEMTRRGFLGACLALAAAPAVIKIESLMKPRKIWVPAAAALEDCIVPVGILPNSELTVQGFGLGSIKIGDVISIDTVGRRENFLVTSVEASVELTHYPSDFRSMAYRLKGQCLSGFTPQERQALDSARPLRLDRSELIHAVERKLSHPPGFQLLFRG